LAVDCPCFIFKTSKSALKSNDLGYFRTNELLYFQKFAYSMLQLTDRKGERAEGRGSIPLAGRGGGGRGS
jgi:hypothetical protein